MDDWTPGFVADVGRALSVFAQWTLLGTLVDPAFDGDEGWRKGTIVWLMVTTFGVNLYGLGRSYLAIGERGLAILPPLLALLLRRERHRWCSE